MYNDTITVFNKYHDIDHDLWYATILEGVDLGVDRASIVEVYGADSKDSARLHIKDVTVENTGKTYLTPKKWENQNLDEVESTITFKAGDFIIKGPWDGAMVIDDDNYAKSFYDSMKTKLDDVYAITTVAHYDCIPHFEIMCK